MRGERVYSAQQDFFGVLLLRISRRTPLLHVAQELASSGRNGGAVHSLRAAGDSLYVTNQEEQNLLRNVSSIRPGKIWWGPGLVCARGIILLYFAPMRPSKLLRLAADACAVSVGIISLAALRVIAQRQRKSRLSTGALYRLPVRSNLALSLLLFAADLCAIPAILRSKKNLSGFELDTVKAAAVPVFDRVALQQIFADKDEWKSISDSVLLAIILMPVLLLLHKEVRSSVRLLFALYAKTHAITYTLYSFSPLGPALQDKYRPVVYYLNEPNSSRAAGNNRNAMYSGHTGNAACASFFAAKVLSDYYPNLNAGKRFSLFALALVPPVLLGICRIKALRHFPADVALAILIGGSCGVLVPEAHRAG